MKIVYEFDSIEDKDDNAIFAQAMLMHSVLYDLSQELRACRKYGNPTARDTFWEERLNALLTENEIKIF